MEIETKGAEVTLIEEAMLAFVNEGATTIKNAAHHWGPRLSAFVHHDDANREAAYDRDADRTIAQASASPIENILLMSMKNDIFICCRNYLTISITETKMPAQSRWPF